MTGGTVEFVMFTVLSILLLASVYGMLRAGRNVLKGYLIYSALNPYLWFLLLLLFFLFDFIALSLSPEINIYEVYIPVELGDVLYSFAFFTFCTIAMAAGSMFASFQIGSSMRSNKQWHPQISKKAANTTFYLVLLLSIVFLMQFLGSIGSMLAGDATRQVFFKENKAMLIVFSMICPAFALRVMYGDPVSISNIFFFLLMAGILTLFGSRGAVLLLTLIWMYSINQKRFIIPRWVYWPAIPFVASLLLILRFIFRESFRYDSLIAFVIDKGGFFSVFFNTAEVSMAESMTAVLKFSEFFHRAPFESVLAAIVYPLPRSIFEWKPISTDALVTSILSPIRWEATQSELVVTGFADFYVQFGYLGAVVACSIVGFFWTKLIVKTGSLSVYSVFFAPFLMWWMYLFLRSGMFNMAGAVWSWMLLYFTATLMDKLLRGKN